MKLRLGGLPRRSVELRLTRLHFFCPLGAAPIDASRLFRRCWLRGNKREQYLVLGGVSVFEAQSHWITRELDKLVENINPGDPQGMNPVFRKHASIGGGGCHVSVETLATRLGESARQLGENRWIFKGGLLLAVFLISLVALLGFFCTKTRGFKRFSTSTLLLLLVVGLSAIFFCRKHAAGASPGEHLLRRNRICGWGSLPEGIQVLRAQDPRKQRSRTHSLNRWHRSVKIRPRPVAGTVSVVERPAARSYSV